MSQEQLQTLRKEIDAVDLKILNLLNQRARLAQDIGHVKMQQKAPVFRPEREAQVLANLNALNTGPLSETDINTIFREVMSSCRALEKCISVAFLGPASTFSEQAVYQQFGHSVKAVPCTSIDEVFRTTENGTSDFGIVPIENSSEGAVSRSLDLLLQTTLSISGEVSLLIHHHLMSQSGMDKVTRICAHSQALAQCQTWLNKNYPDIIRQAVDSNSQACVLAQQDPHTAAIASETASKTYSLPIVYANIQDDLHNKTRFATIGRQGTEPSGNDQTSLILSVPNKAGAVYALLAPLAKHGVSMTRFESRPARMGQWEYYFYVDIKGHQEETNIKNALLELKENVAFFKLLGSYPICA